MVVVPALGDVPHCPVRALLRYLQHRAKRVKTSVNLPLFMTEHLWTAGSVKPNKASPGFYTASKFRKDVEFAVADLVKYYPDLTNVYKWLVIHSLRSGKIEIFVHLFLLITMTSS